jgi:hypothetical protein
MQKERIHLSLSRMHSMQLREILQSVKILLKEKLWRIKMSKQLKKRYLISEWIYYKAEEVWSYLDQG